uniref:nuclear pore complex protein Nup50 n=1 Tax=Ciona intestinalis TaxID=7719 RepID=UPI0000522F2F|nr:nuclear pore complex protein Nup50 [Ciona intestinalis]|eukprot:XP_002121973.1 nuclear pore complex protein Nup50 [Ciona intestinalis]
MSKRVADKYLTDQNWEEEEEPQEAGVFTPADADVLKGRVFKKARRRVGEKPEGSTGAFSGFGGLKPTGVVGSNGFKGFGSSSGGFGTAGKFTLSSKAGLTTAMQGSNDGKTVEVSSSNISESSTSVAKPPAEDKPLETKTNESKPAVKENSGESEYNRHLSALNKSVSQWITDHVVKNPLCDLSPIFKDYQKYLSDIDDKYGSGSQSECDSSQGSAVESSPSSKPTQEKSQAKSYFEIKPITPADTTTLIPTAKSTVTSPPENPLGGFKPSAPSPFKGFGSFASSSKPETTGFTGFQFSSTMVGGSKPVAPDSTVTKPLTTEEEYVPPKNDSQVVTEEDAFYTKKCKLFYMKDGSYTDKGVGHIHLKSVESSSKTQLIIRADTSLGNLLLNILLNPAMPVSKQGKNNVSISCIPNPPVSESEPNKIVPLLIRVKTSDDADELVELLNQKKKESE